MADPFFHELPAGVSCRKLAVFKDGRGILAEVYREEWGACAPPKQWNVVRSLAGTLRGVHVHNAHADYLFVADGHMILGIHDIREELPTRAPARSSISRAMTPRRSTFHRAWRMASIFPWPPAISTH